MACRSSGACIALGNELMLSWVEAMKAGKPVTRQGDVDAVNAEHAARGVVASPEEIAEMLRRSGAVLANTLRTLSDDELSGQVQFGDRLLPAEMLAEASVRHVGVHLASILEVVEAP